MEVQLPSSIIARAVFRPVELNWHWAGTEKGLRAGQNAPVSKILTLARGMDDGERAALAVKGAGGKWRVPLPSAAGTPDRAEHRLPGTIMI